MIIYIAISPSGKSYVGQTTRSLGVRRSEHVRVARGRKSRTHLSAALRKYPNQDLWTWVIASRARDQEHLDALEKFFIPMFGDYNIEDSPRGSGPRSPETRRRMSEACKGRKFPPRSEAQKAALSAALLGVPKSAAHKQKLADAQRGKKLSPETKAKMSATRRGKPWSALRRARYEAKKR